MSQHLHHLDSDFSKIDNLLLEAQQKIKLYERIANIAKVGCWEMELPAGVIKWADETYKIFEVTSDFVPLQENLLAFYPQDVQPIIISAARDAIESGLSWDFDVPFITAKGNKLWVRSQGVPEMQDGKVIKLTGAIQDITDKYILQKRLHEQNQILNSAQRIVNMGYYILDITTGSWEASDILLNLFGIDRNYIRDIAGWVAIVADTDKQMMLDYFTNEVIGQKQQFNKQYRIMRRNDFKERWVQGIGHLEFDKDGNPIRMLGVIQDITERKQAEIELYENEMQLKQQNEEYLQLNEEYHAINEQYLLVNEDLKNANQSLVIAKEKAEENDRLKSAFLSNISHEIRTPMNGIIGFANLIINKELDHEKHKKYVNIIKNCGQQLLNLIDDLVDVAKIEANQIQIDPQTVFVNVIVEEMIDMFKDNASKKSLNIVSEIPVGISTPIIITDPLRLKQIMYNLIGNALKFTDHGVIKVGYTLKDTVIEFFVKDNGIGIAKEHLGFIFDRFSQAPTEKNQLNTGTGLGLSICKSLVGLLGGSIYVESEPQRGSSFYFTIPLVTVAAAEAKQKPTVATNMPTVQKGLNLLVAEDDLNNYMYLNELFEISNVSTSHASNGQEALEMVAKDDYDLVLMDLKMPIMDGFEATKGIKALNPELPVIALTAYSQNNERVKARESGCSDYLTKPVNTQLLFDAINKCIEKHKSK